MMVFASSLVEITHIGMMKVNVNLAILLAMNVQEKEEVTVLNVQEVFRKIEKENVSKKKKKR